MNPSWKIRNPIQLDQKTKGEVWHPEIEFENVLNYRKTKAYGGDTTFSFYIENSKYYNMIYGEKFQVTFSCHFHLSKYPFDSHECQLYFGDGRYNTSQMHFNHITMLYKKVKTGKEDDFFNIDNSPLPWDFQLNPLATKEKDIGYYNVSKAGMLIKIKRKSFGLLLSGYYYPTTTFALFSMVSFIINPDVVS